MVQLAGQTRDYPPNSPPSRLHGWLKRLYGLLTFDSAVLHEGKDEIHDARVWRAYRRSVRRRIRGPLPEERMTTRLRKVILHPIRSYRQHRQRQQRLKRQRRYRQSPRSRTYGERQELPYGRDDIERYYLTPEMRLLGIHHIHSHNRPESSSLDTRTSEFEPYNTLKAHYRHRQIGTLGDRILYTPRSQPKLPPPKPKPEIVTPATTPLVIVPGSSKVQKKYKYGYYT